MGRIRGIEALRRLPFDQVMIRPQEARKRLTSRTREVVVANAREAVFVATHHRHPVNVAIVAFSQAVIANPQVKEGGTSFSDYELYSAYKTRPPVTFQDTFADITTSMESNLVFPQRAKSRTVGVILVGYSVDLLRILNRNVATRDEAIQIMLERWRSSQFITFELLGGMMQDAVSRRMLRTTDKDLYADQQAAVVFRDDVLRLATEDEKIMIRKGIEGQKRRTVFERCYANQHLN